MLDGLTSGRGDLHALPFADASVLSLSCMHTVEHVGLGRYGDPIDATGDLKAMKELARVLAPGGTLLFVVPVGIPRIEFNAHRVYGYEQVLEGFSGLHLKEFSLIPDSWKKHGLIRNADPAMVASQYHGCGCFWFTKE
jgi:SAM-dependent methyltransferase